MVSDQELAQGSSPQAGLAEYRAHVGAAIAELLDVMSCVARGDFSRYSTLVSDDDLGALALGVNLMVSELRENAQLRRVASLEDKLRLKAEQLGRTVAELTATNEELQRYRAKVDEQNRTLEERVRERTAELRELNETLERTNQELNDFTYIVSHDLKEPLRAIEAFSRFLVEEHAAELGDRGQGYVQRIRVNTKRLQEFIDDLLELSRIARISNPYEQVESRSLVEKARDVLSFAIAERGAILTLVEPLPRIRCDRTRIYQVFLNLIENGMKFSDGPPVVEVGCDDGGGEHVFRVADHGIGIEPQYFEQIFQVFQRLHPREAYPGSGAGLTICRKIIERHGGRIWVESSPGQGSTFRFTLPKGEQQPKE